MERPELLPAIKVLDDELAALERQAAELRSTINMLCKRAGLTLRYAEANAPAGPSLTQIRSDSFYGKKMQTAVREFLELRKAQNLSAAKPREIFDALSAGGFEFEAQDETTALISLRATLRKNSGTFHKLPNGQYGLRAWYPNAKAPKPDEEEKTPPAKRPLKRNAKGTKRPLRVRPRPSGLSPVMSFVLDVMKDGAEWTTERLKAEAIARSVPGIDAATNKSVFQGTLLSLKSRSLASPAGQGLWRLTSAKADAESGSKTTTADTGRASAA